MSIQWVLDSSYNYIKNTKLNPALEVGTSIKAPVHYVEDLAISKTESGSMLFDCPVIEATVVQTDSVNAVSGVFTSALAPLVGDDAVLMNGDLDFSSVSGIKNLVSLTLASGAGTENQVLALDANLDLVFKTDNNDVANWSQFTAVSDVNLASHKLDGAKTVTDDVWTSYISLPKDGSSSSMYLNSFNNTAKIPNLLVDSLNKSDSESTQINCNTNLNLSQNTLYANTGNFSSVITNSAQIISLVIPNQTPSAGDVLKIDANENIYWGSDINVPSAWSEYPATQDVDLDSNDIINVNEIQTVSLASNPIGSLINVDGMKLTRRIEMNSKDLYFGLSSDPLSRISADTNGFLISSQQLKLRQRENQPSDTVALEIYNSNSDLACIIEPYVNKLRSSTALKMEGLGTIACAQLLPTFKANRTLWVSSNGNDSTGNGAYENPYLTIQTAINYAESQYNNEYWYINVLPGTYAGFTVTKKCFIKGMAPSTSDGCSVGCQINSDIIISIDANGADMFNNQVSLSGFLIAGAEITCNSGNTNNSILNISDCYLYNDSGSGRLIHYNPDSNDGRLLLFNCRIVNQSVNQNISPLIEMSKGMIRMAQCVCSVSGLTNVLKLNGTSRVDSIVQCSFTSLNASPVLPAIVELSSSGSVFTFSQCAFIYTSSTNKAQNPNSCAILCASAVQQPTLIITYNSFFLAGTSSQGNFAVQDTNFGNARQAIILYFSNNASLNNAFALKGTAGVSKFSLQAVA
jgi:hypothetical protein